MCVGFLIASKQMKLSPKSCTQKTKKKKHTKSDWGLSSLLSFQFCVFSPCSLLHTFVLFACLSCSAYNCIPKVGQISSFGCGKNPIRTKSKNFYRNRRENPNQTKIVFFLLVGATFLWHWCSVGGRVLPEQWKKKAYQLLLQHIVLGCVFACVSDGSLGTLGDFQLCCLGVKMCPCGREHFICVLVRLADGKVFVERRWYLGCLGKWEKFSPPRRKPFGRV